MTGVAIADEQPKFEPRRDLTDPSRRPSVEAYAAAKAALKQREAVPGCPWEGPYPATLDELAEAITDAVWPIAFKLGMDAVVGEILAAIRRGRDQSRCGDWPAPCNCDDPLTHNGH